jgi:hypothetical protein
VSNSGARAINRAGFRDSGVNHVHIAFLDEFGHIGPFRSRRDPKYSQSPVFGLAGYVLPHQHVRHFATFFLHLKSQMLANDLKLADCHPATWEKRVMNL